MRLLIPMLLISTAAAGADIERSRGLTATALVFIPGDTRYSGDVNLWISREPGNPETATLYYSLDVCTGPGTAGCRRERGYGEIPMSAVAIGKDTVTLDIDTASLPPPYSRWEGVGGRIRAEWWLDGVREETTTGARTLVAAEYWFHQTGPRTSRSAAVKLVLIGLPLPATSAAISEENGKTIWHWME